MFGNAVKAFSVDNFFVYCPMRTYTIFMRRRLVKIGFECKQCCQFIKQRRKQSGICDFCGIRNSVEAITQMQSHQGPRYEKYIEGLARFISRSIKNENV